MDVTPLITQGVPVIQGYRNGTFRISGESYTTPVMLTPQGVSVWDQSFDTLPPYDVLLYGTGATQVWPDAALRARVPMEVMTTAAAARTYNALITEGRAVVALLMPAV